MVDAALQRGRPNTRFGLTTGVYGGTPRECNRRTFGGCRLQQNWPGLPHEEV